MNFFLALRLNSKSPLRHGRGDFLLRAVSLVVDDVAVEKFAADIQNVCELPRVTLQEVFVAPLRIPNGDAQSAPIDKALKPRVGRVDAAVKGLDGIEKSAADVGNVFAREVKTVTAFVTVGVFHVKPHGQFKQ